MKLLGLSKLPPDASRSDHLTLARQQRSARKERAKSSSPASLKRGSASRLGSHGGAEGVSGRSIASSADGRYGGSSTMTGGGGTPMPRHPRGGGHDEHYPDEDGGGGSDSEDEEEGVMPHQHHRHPNSEWLDMREYSSLKITPTDLDEQFLQTITDLMNQFPEPPNSDAVTDLQSPATAAFGRRGLHISKPGSQRRVGGGGGGMEATRDVILSRQNPMVQQQPDSRRGGGVRELESPMRIRYAKPEDQFSL